MGATYSYLGFASYQQSCSRSPEHISQQSDQGCGPLCILHKTEAASLSIIDLCTRLGATEKDLRVSRAENAKKEAVIRYLLQYSNGDSHVGIKEILVQLHRQHLALKTSIDRMNKENEMIKSKLGKAEEAIVTLSTPDLPGSGTQSISTSFGSNSDCPTLGGVVTEDLIDLHSDFDSTKLIEEDRTDLDASENEGGSGITSPDHTLDQSFDLEYEDTPYIVHFTESDKGGKSSDDLNTETKNLRVPQKISESVTSISEYDKNTMAFAKSDDSPLDDATSLFRTNCLEELSQRASLMLKRDGNGSLQKSIALASKTAQLSTGINTLAQKNPLMPASSKLQTLHEKVNASTIEPRWTMLSTFESVGECENAASINRKNGGCIRFMPLGSQRDVRRTVIVSNLSPDISLGTLLGYVRGGLVVHAQLLDTINIPGCASKNSALITFVDGKAAREFKDYTERHPVIINSVVANVRVVVTPTWPLGTRLRKAIVDYNRTRCLKVSEFPEPIPAPKFRNDLKIHLKTKIDPLTYMQEGNDGSVELHFSSIDWAGQAYGMLESWKDYQECKPRYSLDPCDQPLKTGEGQRTVGIMGAEGWPAVVDQSGRLTKPEWELDAEKCHGRGFRTGS